MSRSSTSDSGRKPSLRMSAILVTVAVVIAFHEAPFLEFVDYDDVIISHNPALQGGLTSDAVTFAFTETPTNLWNPLTYLSHALDYQIFGNWAGGHHLTNVFFHLASSLLLLAWLRRHTGKNGLALAVSLLFAIHPLRVESVIWISERKDVLSAFFYLLTVTFYSLWAKEERSRRRFYVLAVASALLGLLSKPSLMTLPAALLLVDFWPLRRLDLTNLLRPPSIGQRLLEKLPFLVIALIAAAVAWMTWSGNQFIGEPPDLSFVQRAGFASLAYLTYLSKTFFPTDMVAFLPYPSELGGAALTLAVFLIAIISAVALWQRLRSPSLLFGWLWFVGLIIPGSGLITISDHFAPDRYTYLAHIGLFTALIWGAASLGKRLQIPSRAGWAVLTGLLLPLLFLTHRQSQTWKNAETLWRHAISASDQNYVAHNQLGLNLLKADRFDEGIAELEKAIAANPGFPISIGNMSRAYTNLGQFETAVDWFMKAGPELPDRELYRDDLIQAARGAGESEAASELWLRLVGENPKDPATQLGAADFFYQLGNTGEALSHYRAAVQLDPSNSEANLSLGALLLRSGKTDDAFPFLQQSIAHASNPTEAASARRTTAQAFLLKREWQSAIEQYSEAVKQAPEEALYANELAQLLLDCPDQSLQNPGLALKLARTLPVHANKSGVIPNPRYLRTLARALARNGETKGAAQVATAGLKVVETISEAKPLKAPWTVEEIESLRNGFLRLVAEGEAKQ